MSGDDTATVDIQDAQVHNYRLQDILSTRRDVREVRHGLKQERRSGVDACATYRAALEAHLEELYPLLHQLDRGQRYWHDPIFGTVTVEPDDPGVHGHPQREFRLVGLKSLFNVPDPIVAEFDVTRTVGFGRLQSDTITVEAQPTFDHLDAMYLTASKFLAEIGLTLDEDTEANTIGNISLSKNGDTANDAR